MTDFISSDVLTTLAQVVMIDLVLAGDNAVVIALAAAGLPDKQRRRAILIGIITATILRIVGATIATQLLQVLGLLLVGGVLLLWRVHGRAIQFVERTGKGPWRDIYRDGSCNEDAVRSVYVIA